MADVNALNLLLRVTDVLDALHAFGQQDPMLLPEGSPERAASERIRQHLRGHAARLRALGATAPAPAAEAIDWTGGGGSFAGPFQLVFFDGWELSRVMQLLHDLAVRAFLGQLEALAVDPAAYQAVLRMHAAAARHTAQVRLNRQRAELTDAKPWITGAQPGFDFSLFPPSEEGAASQLDVAAMVYGADDQTGTAPATSAGEDNRVQGRVTLPAEPASSEAYDEPLAAEKVTAVLALVLP
ncbi:hypothetical protein [Longimicrobium sp.]|uniref:hypothetical protein n=1 Tax=Longimicrobium sp. TaxID=2029185 RepID=UPI003B3B25EB